MPIYNNRRSKKIRASFKRGKRGREEPAIRRILRENIRGRRMLLGLTQKQLGETAGYGQSWIQQIESESGDEVPTVLGLPILAEALGCTIADLVTPGRFAAGLKINWRVAEMQRRREAS